MNIDIYTIIIRVFIIYLIVALGILIKYFGSTKKELIQKNFTLILLYFVFPFLIITSILNAQLSADISILIFTILFSFTVMIGGTALIWFYLRNKEIDPTQKATTIICTGFPNSIFLPFPIITLLIGNEGLIYATFFAMGYSIIYNTLGAWIAIKNSTKVNSQDKHYSRMVLQKLLFFPPTFSVIIGLIIKLTVNPTNTLDLLNWLPLDTSLLSTLIDGLSFLSLFLALVVVGLTFETSFKSLKNINLIESSVIRLIIAPTIGLGFIFLMIGLGTPLTGVIIIPIMIQAISG
ncbi:MAG: AEC family transporter, partial [Candidatus Hodarchaeales archaeon]